MHYLFIMQNNSFSFTKINNKYVLAKYKDYDIIMMTESRYINISNICEKYGKKLDTWLNDNKIFIETVDAIIKQTSANDSVIMMISDANVAGSYIHELLVPYIGNWLEPTLGIIISEIINNYTISEYNRLFKEKNDLIYKLKLMINDSTKRGEIRAMFTS